jgi:hypothetical protein
MADLSNFDLRTKEGKEAKALAEAGELKRVEDEASALAESNPATFVLKKNHGMIHDGKHHKFHSEGEVFHVGKDDKLIHALMQSGAILERE